MRKAFALFAFALFAVLPCIAQTDTSTNPLSQTNSATNQITRVLLQRLNARLNSARIVIDCGKVTSAALRPAVYLRNLKRIDTAGCPQEFRLAWFDYVQTWDRKLSGKQSVENLLEVIPLLAGDTRGLNDVARHMESTDNDEAWRRCERVALQFDVDASRVKLAPKP